LTESVGPWQKIEDVVAVAGCGRGRGDRRKGGRGDCDREDISPESRIVALDYGDRKLY